MIKHSSNHLQVKSAWRSLLIANELVELITQDSNLIPYSKCLLVWFTFLACKTIWKQSFDALPVQNDIYDFTIDNSLFLLVCIGCFLISSILSFKKPSKLRDFLDLCSVSNISVFLFDSQNHGFYLHGVRDILLNKHTYT